MAITKEWLKEAANAKSFSKGKEYYNEVDDLVKTGNIYSAVVYGSEEYEVSITDTPNGTPYAECDCPYDYDGICKHIVAVGLNIIDGNFETEEIEEKNQVSIVDVKTLIQTMTPNVSADTFYDEVFMKKEADVRAAFLKLLFKNDEKLRLQFLEYSKPKVVQTPKAIETNLIEKTTEKLTKKLSKLENLDPEKFYSSSRGRYYDYYDEGDDVSDWAIEKIEEAFAPFEIEVKTYMQSGAVFAATEVLIGIYEACLGLEFEGDIEDYIGEDFETVAISTFREIVNKLDIYIQAAVLEENNIKTSILLVLDRWYKRSNFIETVQDFERYFTLLSTDKTIAAWLIEEIKKRKLTLDLINLTLSIADKIDDDALWVQSAESVAKVNPFILKLLLERYFTTNRLVEFHKAANIAFSHFANNDFIQYLKPKVSENYDSKLYINVFLKSATLTSSLDDFLTVRPILSAIQDADFINLCKRERVNLYIDILNKDGHHDKILALIEDTTKSRSGYNQYYFGFDLQKALTYIVEKYPDDVFDLVQMQTEAALKTMKMDRKGYAHACAHLRPLKKLPQSHQGDFKTYLNSLRERYRGKPAFIDELSRI